MRVVVALGGNALQKRGEAMTVENQRENVRTACRALSPVAMEHELVISHGNGPQVGLLSLQASSYDEASTYPFDVLGARRVTAGAFADNAASGNGGIGYCFQATLHAGEYHFPLIDAENSTLGGPTFTLLNPPGGVCQFGGSCTTAFLAQTPGWNNSG